MKKLVLNGFEGQTTTATTTEGPGQKNTGQFVPSVDANREQQQTQLEGSQPYSLIPLEFTHILIPSLKVGGVAGTLGLFTGGVVSIFRYSPNPITWAIATSIQCFALGSSFYGSRLLVSQAWGQYEGDLTPRERIKASAIAGSVAGVASGLLTAGPRVLLPNALLWTVLGAAGQKLVNEYQQPGNVSAAGTKKSWLDSRWSPIQRLSDEEYHSYLQDKILKIEAEMAVIDDNIRDLRSSQKHDSIPQRTDIESRQ